MIRGSQYDNSSICPQARISPATHLVPAANGVGYGYIATADGDVFFDDSSAVKNLRFDQLKEGMIVEYALDQAPYLSFVGCEEIVADLVLYDGGDYRGRRIRPPAASHITISTIGRESLEYGTM